MTWITVSDVKPYILVCSSVASYLGSRGPLPPSAPPPTPIKTDMSTFLFQEQEIDKSKLSTILAHIHSGVLHNRVLVSSFTINRTVKFTKCSDKRCVTDFEAKSATFLFATG